MVHYLPRAPRPGCKAGEYTYIPRSLILNKKLRPQLRAFHGMVRALAFPGFGGWRIPQTKLADRCGISLRSVQRLVREAKDFGLLKVKRFFNGISKYEVIEGRKSLSSKSVRKFPAGPVVAPRRAKKVCSRPPEALWDEVSLMSNKYRPPSLVERMMMEGR
jgi:hypothetical protein